MLSKQETDFSCGPACIKAIISDFSSMTEAEIAEACGTTPEIGTTPHQMVAFLRRFFPECSLIQTDTYQNADIILVQDGGYGHWLVFLNGVIQDPWTGLPYSKPLDTKALVDGHWFFGAVIRV